MSDRRTDDKIDGHKRPEPSAIGDFDLMAYVEGRLDPHRRRQVEAWLAEHPDEAENVRTDIAVTEAIRTLYNPVLTEPIPERLDSALRGPSGRQRGRAMRSVAMAASVLGAGLLGWWAGGQTQAPSGLAVDQRLLSQVTAAYTQPGTLAGTQTGSDGGSLGLSDSPSGDLDSVPASIDGSMEAVSTLNDRMTFEVRAPDLSALGFTMIGQRVADTGQGDIVEVNYADASGERLALFMTTRWQETQPRFRATEHNGVSTAYWYDGPLALALAGDAQPEIIRDLGISVHELMKAGGLTNPALTGPSIDTQPALDAAPNLGPNPGETPTESAATAGSTEADTGAGAIAGSGNGPEEIRVPDSIIRPTPVQQSDREM